MDGLRQTGNPAQPVEIDHLDYLIDIVAYFIYLAGPQHSSVNNAQYALMSFGPCVMGTVYQPAPQRSTELHSEEDTLPWYPPLDVVLYTSSFEYLLNNVQYDRLGDYGGTPSMPYFKDARAQEVLADFQQELAQIEADIRQRNRKRPMPYLLQLPSMVTNSISI
jgi:arachidonate 15-lipoxygenase